MNVPVWFGHNAPALKTTTTRPRALLNSEFASYAFHAMYFSWAVYGIRSQTDTSPQQSIRSIYRSISAWHVIPLRPAIPYLRNLHLTRRFSVVVMTSYITFGHPVKPRSFTVI